MPKNFSFVDIIKETRTVVRDANVDNKNQTAIQAALIVAKVLNRANAKSSDSVDRSEIKEMIKNRNNSKEVNRLESRIKNLENDLADVKKKLDKSKASKGQTEESTKSDKNESADDKGSSNEIKNTDGEDEVIDLN